MRQPVLEVRDLVVARSGVEILNLDHLQVFEGETLAVIGPNGAGKSTLLLTLSRLIKKTDGEIVFKGQSLDEIKELDYRRQLGMVLQAPLMLDKSVYANVATGLRFHGVPRREIAPRIEHWLGKLGILHLRDRRASKLSGGEAQRVSLARAFALEPELLLLDEPFSALDAPTRAHLLEDFQALLADTQVTTIFITHDLDEALYLGDRVAVLLDGRLRQVGPPEDVFSAPADPDVAAFVGVETVITGQVIDTQDGMILVRAEGMQLEAIADVEVGRDVFACLRPEEITLLPCGDDIDCDPSPRSSARNRLAGRICRMVPQGPLVKVVIDCGSPVVALITRSSAHEMGLVEGTLVRASFKASVVHVIPR